MGFFYFLYEIVLVIAFKPSLDEEMATVLFQIIAPAAMPAVPSSEQIMNRKRNGSQSNSDEAHRVIKFLHELCRQLLQFSQTHIVRLKARITAVILFPGYCFQGEQSVVFFQSCPQLRTYQGNWSQDLNCVQVGLPDKLIKPPNALFGIEPES